MTTVVTRLGKGSPLTWAEGDANTNNLNNEKIERNGSIPFTADQSFAGFKPTNVGTPTNSTDAANKAYVDGLTSSLPGGFGYRNSIINGDMRIDQRNSGAAVTVNSTTQQFPVDRFYGTGAAAAGVFTLQQQAVATIPPAGFSRFLRATVTTADAAIAAGRVYRIGHRIEGVNCQLFGFGSGGAIPVTLSFWVRSSVAGSFSGSLSNSANNRSYPFSYTINSANTWEFKTITIPGDTTGTWLFDNGIGIELSLDLGAGSSVRGTAGSWQAATLVGVTGAVSLISTLSATFDITGVQLEAGTVATPFERQSYDRQVAQCLRYFQRASAVPNQSSPFYGVCAGVNAVNRVGAVLQVNMRTTPTFTLSSNWNAYDGINGVPVTGLINNYSTPNAAVFDLTCSGGLLVPGRIAHLYNGSGGNATLDIIAEL